MSDASFPEPTQWNGDEPDPHAHEDRAAWEDDMAREDESDGRCPTCGALGDEPCMAWCSADAADNTADPVEETL